MAAAYLVVSSVIGVSLLVAPDDPTARAEPPPTGSGYGADSNLAPTSSRSSSRDRGPFNERSSSRPPTTSTPPVTTTAPAGFMRVNGPAGVQTVIPNGWRVSRSTGPGAMQATDPADGSRFVKFGGSAAPVIDISTSHVQYENGFATRTPGYRRLDLSSATYGGHPAVEWEFEHTQGTAVRHVRSLYWRAQGNEYFVFASGPADRWADTVPIYDAMVAHSSP